MPRLSSQAELGFPYQSMIVRDQGMIAPLLATLLDSPHGHSNED